MFNKIKKLLSRLAVWPGCQHEKPNPAPIPQPDLDELVRRSDEIRKFYKATEEAKSVVKTDVITCSKCGRTGSEDDFYCDVFSSKYYCQECWDEQ